METFLRAAALLDVGAFVAAVPGPFVLVRLDERGGRDEPVAWAWDVLMAEPSLVDPDDDDSGEDVFVSALAGTGMAAESDEATATGPAQPPLPIPPAREAATVVVVPAVGGRIGRQKGAVVRVAERSVSRQHALMSVDGGSCSVVDLDADNGTSVNGLPLVAGQPQTVRSGDVLGLGDVSFLFLDVRAFYSHLPALAGNE